MEQPDPVDVAAAPVTSVAVTGGTGVVGRHLRASLTDRRVTLLGRCRPVTGPQEAWFPFDMSAPVALPALPAGTTLCHLAYAITDGSRNLAHTRHVINAVNQDPDLSHVIVVSSASVYGAASSGVIDEDTPLRPDSDYARTKAACERAWADLLRPDCRLTTLRPTSVLAADGPAIDALASDAVDRPLLGMLKRILQYRNTVHFVAVDNVVAAILFVLDRRGARRETFVVSDDDAAENDSYAAMQDCVRSLAHRRPLPTLPLPRMLEKPLGAMLGKPLGVRRAHCSARLTAAGFVRPARLSDEIARSVRGRFSQALLSEDVSSRRYSST